MRQDQFTRTRLPRASSDKGRQAALAQAVSTSRLPWPSFVSADKRDTNVVVSGVSDFFDTNAREKPPKAVPFLKSDRPGHENLLPFPSKPASSNVNQTGAMTAPWLYSQTFVSRV